jgi:iron complex outermembrane recepter protein
MIRHTRIARAIVFAFGGGALLAAAPVLAQQAPAPAAGAQQLDRVEITGSSIRRIEGETSLPVQVITRDDIQRTAIVNVEQLLQTISATSSNQGLQASSASGATTLGISAVSLRGLSPQRTLVLINGKRITPYGYGATNDSVSVDVNAIPLSAIDRVEVLKDGASAVYGSDAIAGVVNFIIRRDFAGTEITAEYGQARGGSAATTKVSGVWGMGNLARERFNVLVTVNYDKEKALFGRERSFATSSINLDALNDGSSGNTFPANIVAVDGSFGTRNPSFPACPGPYAVRSVVFDTIGYLGCRFDPSPLVTLLPDTERVGIFSSARFAITPTTEAYAELSFTQNESTTVIQPAPISDQFALPPNHPLFAVAPYNGFSTIVLSPTSPFYPTAFVQQQTGGATPDLLVRWRGSAVGDRSFTDTSKAPRMNLGIKGTAASWDYDAGALYSQSKVSEYLNDGYTLLTQILPILNSGQVNFFGPNSASVQAQLDATKFRGDALKTDTSLTSLYAKGSRELMNLGGGPLAMALGGEFRKETYKLTPTAAILTGDLSGYGGNFLPVDVSRDVKALFAEVNLPIVRSFEANIAVRYDDYEGVGSKTTPKIGLRFQPTREVLLRASIGKGFRAPSLLDLFAPQTTGVTPPGLSDPLRCPTTGGGNDCNTQFANLNGGFIGLKPEESTNATIGMVLEPTQNVSVTVDYFNIALEETIVNGITAATILNDLGKYGQFVTRGPTDPAFPNLPGPIVQINQLNLNQGRTNLSGVDLDVRWRIPLETYGRLSLGLSGTYFRNYDTQNPDGSYTGNVDEVNNSTGGLIARWRHYLSSTWSRGPWAVTLAQNYQGGYNDLPNSEPSASIDVPRTVSSYTTYDTQVLYTGIRNLTLTAGIRNLADTDPPYTNAGGQVYFQAGYDPGYADPRGRFVYGKVSYRF